MKQNSIREQATSEVLSINCNNFTHKSCLTFSPPLYLFLSLILFPISSVAFFCVLHFETCSLIKVLTNYGDCKDKDHHSPIIAVLLQTLSDMVCYSCLSGLSQGP